MRGDFDALIGNSLAGNNPYIISGFNIPVNPSPIGLPANKLQLVTANGVVYNPLASESGTLLVIPNNRANELLNSTTNTNVVGSFTAGSTNIVGIDFVRSSDSTTNDNVQFLAANSTPTNPLPEISKSVPLARTLNYIIVITTNTFAVMQNLAPIAKVVTDANNNVTSITDARQMMFRFGEGLDTPSAYATYPSLWAQGRIENPITTTTGSDPFYGGDKAIGSLRAWCQAVMGRLQEIGGGQFWYSAVSNFNVKLVRQTVSVLSDNFVWTTGNPGTLKWEKLALAYENSDINSLTPNLTYIQIADNSSTGVTLSSGQCLYVDLDRSATSGTLTANTGTVDNLGQPNPPYSRIILAYCEPDTGNSNSLQVFTRDSSFQVGAGGVKATASQYGVVELNTNQTAGTAIVPSMDATGAGNVIVGGITRGSGGTPSLGNGTLFIGTGTNDQSIVIDTNGAAGARTVAIGNNSTNGAQIVNIGTSTTAVNTIALGGSTVTSLSAKATGASGVATIDGGTVNLGNTSATTILVGNSANTTSFKSVVASANLFEFDAGASAVLKIQAAGATAPTLQVLSGTNTHLDTETGASKQLNIGTANTANINIGGTNVTGSLSMNATGSGGSATLDAKTNLFLGNTNATSIVMGGTNITNASGISISAGATSKVTLDGPTIILGNTLTNNLTSLQLGTNTNLTTLNIGTGTTTGTTSMDGHTVNVGATNATGITIGGTSTVNTINGHIVEVGSSSSWTLTGSGTITSGFLGSTAGNIYYNTNAAGVNGSPTIQVTSYDNCGDLSFAVTTTSAAAGTTLISVIFHTAYSTTPKVLISPGGHGTYFNSTWQPYVSAVSTTGFSIANLQATGTGGNSSEFTWMVIG
ncbi:MAG: hypothetical protein KGO96_07775 [Elusimicrobia bacterium]|nr:hypothetical protein [Elusimicrobiota bacterium]